MLKIYLVINKASSFICPEEIGHNTHMFSIQLIIGTILICITVVIHAVMLDFLLKFLERSGPAFYKAFKDLCNSIFLVITVLGIFLAHTIQIWIWAVFYFYMTGFQHFEEALYFSTSTFSTLGMGDIVLNQNWRLLSAIQSANGFILFGWSTAFIFEIMLQLYRNEKIRKT